MSEAPHEVMSWDELGAGARSLAEAVRDDGFAPDLVLGVIFLNEGVSWQILVGAVVVLASVALVIRSEAERVVEPFAE